MVVNGKKQFKMNQRYENGKIYSIRCLTNPELVYVGSTCQTLCKRWTNHKAMGNQKPDRKLYKTIFENGGFGNFYIELVESFPCSNREQLLKREGEIMREISTVALNTSIPGSRIGKSQSEYEITRYHTEHRQNWLKKYKEENKEIIKQREKEYRERNKQTVQDKNKKRCSEYYYQNLESIKEKRKETTICECGSTITKAKLSRHIKSSKHLTLMEQKYLI